MVLIMFEICSNHEKASRNETILFTAVNSTREPVDLIC